MKYLYLILAISFFVPAAQAQQVDPESGKVTNQLLVQLEKDAALQPLVQRANQRYANAVTPVRVVARSQNIHLLQFDPARCPAEALAQWLEVQPEVQYQQANYKIDFRNTPNDPDYDLQWGAERIGLPEVWAFGQGGVTANGDTIVIAILDSGFDLSHEDISGNTWVNPRETPGDGIDNDGNGYIDDMNGWDFRSDSPEIAFDNHGLQVSGVLAATANNDKGIAGVCWDAKIMYLSIRYIDDIISAYAYALEQRQRYNETLGAEGAFVVATNASFGLTDPFFCAEYPIWGNMYDLMGEVGILTGAGTANKDRDIDRVGDMPTSCESDFIMTVLNSTEDEEKFTQSGYGKVTIDMAAPGEGSYSLAPFNRYAIFGGNSASAPHLTGAIGLLYSMPCEFLATEALTKPKATALFVRSVLEESVDRFPAYEDLTVTGGRLNVRSAMNLLSDACGGTTGDLDLLNIYPNPARDRLNIQYETPDFETYEFRIYNTLGQLVYRNNDTPARFREKRLEVDVSRWQAGMYVVEVFNGERVETRPFIVLQY
ncbi:MAG: S8/S53 family peptidase [Phaeodactylibacter sp.]|uniref:S8/S53 family peptidase n=1 Tax=Phaeodactylibacter sp. TaxID=1940289 RepID=UPI0032EED338